MDRIYHIATQNTQPGAVDWRAVPVALVDVLPWGGAYAPRSMAQVVRIPAGFAVRMQAEERAPRTVERGFSGLVYTDSCLEFFAQFDAESDPRYLNFEFNSAGAHYLTLGTCRRNRVDIALPGYAARLNVRPFRDVGFWGIEYLIPFDFLNEIYTGDSPSKYAVMRGNFYKCGDRTDHPHYLCWNPIDLPEPDFHSPAFFGKIVVSASDSD